jgi:hypothetical protein
MPCFRAAAHRGRRRWRPWGKVPLLFGLTLLVTFPSLYVFNALVGSQLTLSSVLRLIVAADGYNAGYPRFVRTYCSVLFDEYNQLPFYVAAQRHRLLRGRILRLKFLLHALHQLSIARATPAAATRSSNQANDAVQNAGHSPTAPSGASTGRQCNNE